MPYRSLEDIATADAAFEAWGQTREELFVAAAEATLSVMVADLQTVAPREAREIRAEAEDLDMLLFALLQELVYYKDAEQLLLRVKELRIEGEEGSYALEARAGGERLDPSRHELLTDVKAVTLHRFRVEKTPGGWAATVVLDL